MIPVSNFSYSPTALSVSFTDSSVNSPTTWAWDFGDPNSGPNNVSVIQNPSHSYSLPGEYTVSLTVTNVDGSSTKTLAITVADAVALLSISEMVAGRIPAGITIDINQKDNYIKIEQLFLQPLLNPPISDTDIFIESKWPYLANVLVAELVSYRLITDQVNNLILALSSSSSSTTSNAQRELKKIVTGPSEAEWYNSAETTTNFLTETFKSGSIFDKTSLGIICALASRLGIQHPFCPIGAVSENGVSSVSRPVVPLRIWNKPKCQ
mgnify:CR=1 FL=1